MVPILLHRKSDFRRYKTFFSRGGDLPPPPLLSSRYKYVCCPTVKPEFFEPVTQEVAYLLFLLTFRQAYPVRGVANCQVIISRSQSPFSFAIKALNDFIVKILLNPIVKSLCHHLNFLAPNTKVFNFLL